MRCGENYINKGSRFARNTADSLMYARLLKEYGVSILFEKENIDTAYMSSELLLALSGAQAQEESISISKNMRWSIERRMKAGTFIASHTACTLTFNKTKDVTPLIINLPIYFYVL